MKFSVEKKSFVRKRKIETLRKQMIKEENFHINDLINYTEFLELYAKYGEGFQEEEFAHAFLDLLKTDFYSLKKNRCKILKREVVDDLEIAFIKLQVIDKFKLTPGTPVSYTQLVQIYNSVPSKLSLVQFAEKILDVTSHSVSCIKCDASKNATVFNKTDSDYFETENFQETLRKIEEPIITRKKKLQELKDTIAEDRNLHIGDSITPDEFYEMYEIYGKDNFSYYDFGRQVLGLSEGKARGLINRKIENGQIWTEEIVSLKYLFKLRKEIIEKENLHINDKIDTYEKFQNLFRKYAGILSETMFAEEVLDISRNSYKTLKIGKTEAFILTDIDVPEEFWKAKQEDIKNIENFYNGQKITYDEFLKVFQKYGYITWDADFAEKVLHVSKSQFACLKRGENQTTRIFYKRNDSPNKINYDELELKKLREIVINENKLHIEDTLSGKRFEELYEKYGFGMSKKTFGEKILDIKSYRLNAILRDETDNTIILTNEKIDKDYLKSLRGKLFKSGEHCTEDMIDYKEFQRLYKIYGGKLSEVQFAEKVLFITNINLKQIKEKRDIGRETKIFANLKLSDAYIANLKARIIEKNLLYYKQNITPEFFRKIYREAKTVLSEADFAKLILEVQQRQVYYKACVNRTNETFRILSISGTNKNKDKFLEKQNATVKEMLENGFSYEEIAETTNLTRSALEEKVKVLHDKGLNLENAKKNYVLNKLKSGEEIEPKRAKELGIDNEYIKQVKEELKAQQEFEKLERKCFNIADDLQESKHSKRYIMDYIKICKEKYAGKFKQMTDKTLECLNTCLEYLEDGNIENTKFFIQACIAKADFYRANGFITYSMQTPKIDVNTKKTLQELRQYVKHSMRKNQAVIMIGNRVPVNDIVKATDLSEIDVRNLMKKLTIEKQKV